MPGTTAAPSEADALRRLAEAAKRVHFPATLLHFLLALLAFLTGNKSLAGQATASLTGATVRTWRTPLRDWHFSPNGETIDDLAPVISPGALRRLRQQRAWIGWILRCEPGKGMRRSGKPNSDFAPTSVARAPPKARSISIHPESVFWPPLRAATTHAHTPGANG